MNIESIKKDTMKNILMYSIPAIIAMVLSSFVTIVDGIFVSNMIDKEALASINLGLPILHVFLAVGIMIGVGGVSIAGRRLGERNIDKSINGFNQTVVTGIVACIILSIIFTIILRPILSIAKVDPATQSTMLDYFNVMIWVYPFMMLNIIFGMFIRGEGKHSLFMINTIITTILNIILDYLFIGIFGLGVSGVAYASAIAVIIGNILMIVHFISPKTIFSFKKYSFDKEDFKQTFINGGSEFIGQISLSITMFFLNLVIMERLGLIGVAGMTIIGYSQYVYNMIIIGFGQGISPMISYSYGAKEYEICDKLRGITSKLVTIIGILFFALLNFGGSIYASLFTPDIILIELVAYGLRIFCFSFIVAGYNVISSFYFTSIGYAKQSAIISGFRGLIFLGLNICLLPIIFGDVGIWLIAPVTETGTLLVSFCILKKRVIVSEKIA